MSSGRLSFRPAARDALKVSASSIVQFGPLGPRADFLHVYQATAPGLGLAPWLAARRQEIQARLLECGALLFRGFDVPAAAQFGEAARAVYGQLLGYLERAASRTEVVPNVFTSTELACDQHIPLHHEMSYSHNWPTQIFFFCSRPAEGGGQTPLADERRIIARLPARIRQRFAAHGVMYVRNYRPELEPWSSVFQTEDRAAVEEYCRASRIDFEWLPGNCLRTRQVRQALATHPVSGQEFWFNHALLFHSSNIPAELRRNLLDSCGGEQALPRNSFFGDGTAIDEDMLREIAAIYAAETVTFQWERGDVLLLDNFLTSHGRQPYRGPREILVAMSNLHTNHALSVAHQQGQS